MARLAVPDEHNEEYVQLVGTHPNESATRVGAPRDGHVRIEEENTKTLQIREDDDGRYVGTPEQYVDDIRAFFAEEYGVEYDDDGGDEEDDESDPVAEVQDMQWKAAETAILNGEYDDALGDLQDADLTDSKADAVAQRTSDLNEGE